MSADRMSAAGRVERVLYLVGALLVSGCGGSARDTEADAPVDAEAPVAANPASELPQGVWRLVTIVMADGEDVMPGAERVPFIVFSDEATPTGSRWLSGSGGCTEFTGAYDAGPTGRFATAGRMVISAGVCSEAERQLANLFLIGLESATSYQVDGDSLALDFGGGTLRLTRGP